MDSKFSDKYLGMVDQEIVCALVFEVLCEDADLAESLEEQIEDAFLKKLETPTYQRKIVVDCPEHLLLKSAQQERRLRVASDGSPRATWLTIQADGDNGPGLLVGIA